jgi:hypothetical protein
MKTVEQIFDRVGRANTLTVLAAWNLWLQRNARVLQSVSATAVSLVDRIWATCELWCKAKLVERSLLDAG